MLHMHCQLEKWRASNRFQHGFTLIELMVTVAVLAIVAMIAYPNFTSLMNSNRLAGSVNDLVGDLQYARSEAIRRNAHIVVCASPDGTTCGDDWQDWIVMVEGDDEVLRIGHAKPPVLMQASAAVGEGVVFRADGMARKTDGSLLNANFGVCIETTHPQDNVRVITIESGSRISNEKQGGSGQCAAPQDPANL